MKLEFNRKYTTIAIYAFLVLAAVVLFLGLVLNIEFFTDLLGTVGGLLTPFIYGFGLAYILNPVLKFIENKLMVPIFKEHINERLRRGISIFLTFVSFTAFLTVFIVIVIPQLIASISGLVASIPQYIETLDILANKLVLMIPWESLDTQAIQRVLEQYVGQLMQSAYEVLRQCLPWLVRFTARIASGMLTIIIGVIISIYMLFDKEKFYAGAKKIWYAILPNEKADFVIELANDANRIFGGFINGKLLDSLIIGIICFFGMSLLNMPNVMLVSVIVGITNVIPYFGPFIGAIPSFFIILIEDPIKSLWFIVFIIILQQFDGNILGPKILGDSTGLSALWVIFSITLFGGLYGFVGMFLGVPTFAVIFMLFKRFIDSRLGKKDMPLSIGDYCAPEFPIPKASPKRTEESRKRMRAEQRSRLKGLAHLAKSKEEPTKEEEKKSK